MVRGYHIYKEIWNAVVGEEFSCKRENGNRSDPFAVAVVNAAGTIIGHLPRKISCVCSLYLRRNGSIYCRVTGSRRYSEDLEQGGLEIPCILTFEGDSTYTSKAKKVVESNLATTAIDRTPSKRRKVTKSPAVLSPISPFNVEDYDTSATPTKPQWVKLAGIELTQTDKEDILSGKKLDDRTINIAQGLLKRQFKELTGLRSTLLQAREPPKEDNDHCKIQIVHSRGDHWIVASTILATENEVKVYDSLYRTIDRNTRAIIKNIFPSSASPEIIQINRQTGGVDCGVFAIAISTALAFYQDPSGIKFDQPAMRPHLVRCLEKGKLTLFPSI